MNLAGELNFRLEINSIRASWSFEFGKSIYFVMVCEKEKACEIMAIYSNFRSCSKKQRASIARFSQPFFPSSQTREENKGGRIEARFFTSSAAAEKPVLLAHRVKQQRNKRKEKEEEEESEVEEENKNGGVLKNWNWAKRSWNRREFSVCCSVAEILETRALS